MNGQIVFGLTAIKGLGRGAAEEIVRARDDGGPFKDLFDFCERVDRGIVPKAADREDDQGRGDGLPSASGPRTVARRCRRRSRRPTSGRGPRRGQKNFFDLFDDGDGRRRDATGGRGEHGLPDVPEWPELEKLKFEKEALDFYMSSPPAGPVRRATAAVPHARRRRRSRS